MPKLILNCIVKNESHCILKMLESAAKISDSIVIVDTGSTDGTQDIIKKFGEDNNIPTYVFERPFDNFEKSRNFAMSKLNEVIKELNWNDNETWGWWCDADEQLIVYEGFNKNQFNKDLYMITTYIGSMQYTRNTFFRLSKKFEWYGPVHEYIIPKESNISSGVVEGLAVNVEMIGNSWQGDISKKYKKHADVLEDYIIDDKNPRWLFYTAQSWHDSATTKSKSDNEERLRRSLKYYQDRVSMNEGYPEERFYSQYRVGIIKRNLEYSWSEVKRDLLKAYSIDPLRGESIRVIIEYYQRIGEWDIAYLYSKFGYDNFHDKSPYPTRLLFVDTSLYIWRFMELHMNSLFYLNKVEESKILCHKLIDLTKKNPTLFKPEEINRIINNSGQILK